MHSNVTIKNVSWPHFSWATVYTELESIARMKLQRLHSIIATSLMSLAQHRNTVVDQACNCVWRKDQKWRRIKPIKRQRIKLHHEHPHHAWAYSFYETTGRADGLTKQQRAMQIGGCVTSIDRCPDDNGPDRYQSSKGTHQHHHAIIHSRICYRQTVLIYTLDLWDMPSAAAFIRWQEIVGLALKLLIPRHMLLSLSTSH